MSKMKPVSKDELKKAFYILLDLANNSPAFKDVNCPFEELCEVECVEAFGRSCFLERLDATKTKPQGE
jgi:hypothetical protein